MRPTIGQRCWRCRIRGVSSPRRRARLGWFAGLVGLFSFHLSPAQGPPQFDLKVIDDTISQPWLKTVGDLDGDGRPDMIVGGAGGGGLVAFYNRFPSWERQVIDGNRKFSTDGEVADMNGDGRADIIALTRQPDGVVWYESTGSGWQVHEINSETWHDVEVGDLDGDGFPDLVGRNQKEWPHNHDAGNRLHLAYQQRTKQRVAWEFDTIDCVAGEGLLLNDVDRDGDPDIVINQSWFENLGARHWQRHSFAGGSDWSYPNTFVAVGDLNGDHRTDIVLSPSELKGGHYQVAWFEGPKDPHIDNWRKHVIVDDVETVLHFVGVADFDGDGRADVATAEMPQGSDPDDVTIYLNRGKTNGGGWTDRWIAVVISQSGSHSMRIFDADGDTRPDLFGANWSAQGQDEKVKLWLNRSP